MGAQNDNETPNESEATTRQFGLFTKLIFRLTGVDEETMSKCPEHDASNVRALGWLLIASFLFQTLLLTLIGHRLFAAPEEFRPVLLLGAAGIAFFILMIDAYVFYRSGFETAGIDELRRGGLDVGGPSPTSKIGYLIARIVLSVGFAQLTSIFVALIIFGSDIDARIQATYQNSNARLLAHVTVMGDKDIQRATVAVQTQVARVESLSNQVAMLRQHDIDPAASDPQIRQAQQEVTRLLDDKAKADDEVMAAENFGSMELGGVKSAPGNSGIAGKGPRYRAALEAVENAKSHARDTATRLEAARSRLDALHQNLASSTEAEKQRSHGELPGYEATLSSEEAKLAALKEQLVLLIKGRADAIRQGVERAADYVAPNNGFLGQLVALELIGAENPKIGSVILLIDVVSFGLELAAVLAKVCSYVPMKYSALLARNAYATITRIVGELRAELESAPKDQPEPPVSSVYRYPANDNTESANDNIEVRTTELNIDAASLATPDGSTLPEAPIPPKRKRGRPKKASILN